MNARIIQLAPTEEIQSVTFEEAFGEYSEAQGKGRAKRKARKLERIENRREVKKARIAARDEVKSDRQDKRISRRERRKAGRQAIRTEQMGARQERRTGRQAIRAERRGARVESRLGRKQMKRDFREPQPIEEENVPLPVPQPSYQEPDQGYDPNQGYLPESPDQGYAPQDEDQGYAPETPEQGEQPQGGGMAYNTYDEEPYREPMYSDEYDEEPTGEGEYNEDGDYVGEESGYLSDYDASGDNFDGVLNEEKTLDGINKGTIDPQIQATVDKLVWNAECARRLEAKRKRTPNQAQDISKRIIAHKRRFNELKSSLDGFCECTEVAGTVSPNEPRRRKMMIKKAMLISKGKVANAGKKAPVIMKPADDVIPVASDLNPSFSPNRIVVPNQMASAVTGNTGLTGIDLQDDFDAPNAREIFIGVDGSKTKVSWGSVLIGVGVGVAAVWAIKKYKLLK